MDFIYMDHAATTKIAPEVLQEMMPYFEERFGNASSVYPLAVENRRAIERARSKVQYALHAKMPSEIIFTSGGSEADNMAIKGVAHKRKEKGKHIITSKIEHSAVLNSCRALEREGFEVTYLDVDDKGLVSPQILEKAIRKDTILISVMFANNEIGTIEPIEEIGNIAKEKNVLFHVDAVQAVGSLPVDVQKLQIDLLSMSAHKFYGPKGVGALYVRNPENMIPLIEGGHQEFSLRGGTENVAGIVGMGKAIEMATQNLKQNREKVEFLRNQLAKQIQSAIPNYRINGSWIFRHPANLNVSFQGVDGRVLVLLLAEQGVYASSGSACNSADTAPSHVLKAIGLSDEEATSAIRLTVGKDNTIEQVYETAKVLKETVERLRKK